ncbi:MAG: hypothetical protein JWN65_2591 [Solirubrobacterales bacterium]|jgi:hypothetical protein|nr:hypothetical protein [Solirubrobacterales bacterium]
MEDLASVLTDAGGVRAPRERGAQLRRLLGAELHRGAADLQQTRSGYERPICVAIAAASGGGALLAVLPVDPALRADPHAIGERAWLLTAATVGALVEAGARHGLTAGRWGGHLVLALSGDPDAELAALAFEEQAVSIDRLRARALAVPGHVLDDAVDLRPPIGAGHPLLVAGEVARQGGRPADPDSVQELEETVLALLEGAGGEDPASTRPHDDPDPARRAARRMLQRLAGMGKWGGYHTEFAHLARGFAPSDRALAAAVGEALLDAGLLVEKPSVGQRHVFLDPRRAGDIHALTDRGDMPAGLVLPDA